MSGHQNDKVTQTIETILNRATARDASSIHIEPRPHISVIRIRSNGHMHDLAKLPAKHHEDVINQLRSMVDDQQRFHHHGEDRTAIVRLHIAPVVDGDKAVLHLTYRQTTVASLAQRGYWGKNVEAIEHALSSPHGVIQVASLNQVMSHQTQLSLTGLLQATQHNIITVSASTTHDIEGINQLMSPQHEQAERLRFALQQDGDVIVMGTVTDPAAAELSYEVGLGNRLIIGSVYAADGAQLIRRTLDMGIAQHLVAGSLKLILAERQVQQLCQACRVAYQPSKTLLQKCARRLDKHNFFETAHQLETAARQAGLGSDVDSFSSNQTLIGRLWKASPVGCERCHFTGHQGVENINEVLIVKSEVQRAIIRNGSADDIRVAAVREGMISQDWDGFVKALRGLVSLEEIFGKQYR